MVRKSTLAGVLAIGFALAVPAVAADKATAVLKDAKGNEVGKAELTAAPSGVLISLTLSAVPAGELFTSTRSANAIRLTSSPPVPTSIPTRRSTG